MFERSKRALALMRGQLESERQQPALKRRNEELEFLPAAVEILDTPPSPFARTLMLVICTMLVVSLLLLWLSFIDTESVAEGRLIPVGKVKTVQSLVLGRVEAIHAREGEHVHKGQLLVKLDPTEAEVDVRSLESSLLFYQLNTGRLALLLQLIQEPQNAESDLRAWFGLHPKQLSGTPVSEQWATQQRLLDYEYKSFVSADRTLKQELERREASINAAVAELQRLKELRPLHEEFEEKARKLSDKGHMSRLEWLASREKQIDTSQKLLVVQHQLQEARAARDVTLSERQKQYDEFHQERMGRLNDYTDKINELKLTILKAHERDQNCYIYSPIDGTVQQLQVTTIGSVVEPAATLMVLVPENAELQVEAMALNKDIGFIETGMPVDIKIETFPYTFFGSLSGQVVQVSRDAVDGGDKGLVYPLYVSLDKQSVNINGSMQQLQVDMAVTAEVKTGRRRLLEYFMEPFLRYRDETLNER
ncbi:MAG: HlyD family type I secretion periplasmic adaptor subunit [Endozoicomonas sp.]